MPITKVLLIDDEPSLRRVTELALRMLSKWQVTVAESGAAAIAMVESAAPDLVLLDVMMPGLDGPETLRRLRAIPCAAEIPVIFMTASGDATTRSRLLEAPGPDLAPAVGILPKPYDPLTLVATIERLVLP